MDLLNLRYVPSLTKRCSSTNEVLRERVPKYYSISRCHTFGSSLILLLLMLPPKAQHGQVVLPCPENMLTAIPLLPLHLDLSGESTRILSWHPCSF